MTLFGQRAHRSRAHGASARQPAKPLAYFRVPVDCDELFVVSLTRGRKLCRLSRHVLREAQFAVTPSLAVMTDAVEKVAEEMLWNRNAQRSNPASRFLESTLRIRG
jgi:hypothetical protein